MNLCDMLKDCGCFSADQTTIDYLPSGQTGVYAFYDAFRFTPGKLPDEIDEFAMSNARCITLDCGEMPNAARIKFRGTADRFKGKGLQRCKALPKEQEDGMAPMLAFLSILSEPLYIGETTDIKERFRAHHDSGFLFKMKKEGRAPSSFIFFFIKTPHDWHRILEPVLIHLIGPAHNVTGNISIPSE